MALFGTAAAVSKVSACKEDRRSFSRVGLSSLGSLRVGVESGSGAQLEKKEEV